MSFSVGIGAIIQVASFAVTVILAVWRITVSINKQKAEIIAKISGVEVKLKEIEVDTKHSREDHDLVVKMMTHLETTRKDVQNQWNRIKETDQKVADIEKDVDQWGGEISKLVRTK